MVTTGRECIDRASLPLRKGDKVQFEFWLRFGEPSARKVCRIAQ